MHTLSFLATSQSLPRPLPWLQIGMQQLLDIAKASAAIIRNGDEELCASSPVAIDAACSAMEFLFEVVPEARYPLVTANSMTGDITILFENANIRLELIVHNDQPLYSCFKSDEKSSSEIDNQGRLIEELKNLAA
jgi:hypothetical protein